jgi:methylase of polypeptide subunit release factors
MNGGYDDGYAACPCLWGKEPGSLVARFLGEHPDQTGRIVFDLGCGEGKNAAAFARAGGAVRAVDCSTYAIDHAKTAWGSHDNDSGVSQPRGRDDFESRVRERCRWIEFP